MNLVTLITGIVLAMAVLELLLHGMPRMKRDLFYVAMVVSWVGFTSKYYYGPDIVIYTLLYDTSWSLKDLVFDHYTGGYEIGYVYFNSICKSLGLSFWWMTAIISTLFFLAVFLVLRRLRDKRILALALVLVIMKDLIYAQFRQCLAVSFFIFALIEAEGWRTDGRTGRKDLASAAILGFIAMTMHKSAIFMVSLTVLYYMIQPIMMRRNTWAVLLVLLVLLTIIPTWNLIEAMTSALQMNDMTMDSIRLHLSFMKLRQVNLMIYMTALLVLTQYSRGQERRGFAVATVSMGLIVIVVLYQYYFMVDRLRSYFSLPVIFYVFNTMEEASEKREPYANVARQVCEIVLLVYMAGKAYSFDRTSRAEQGDLLEACTVFDLIDENPWEVQSRQMEKGNRFWASDKRSDSGYIIPGVKIKE